MPPAQIQTRNVLGKGGAIVKAIEAGAPKRRQRNTQRSFFASDIYQLKLARLCFNGNQRGVKLSAPLGNDGHRLRLLRRHDDRRRGLDDSGFLACNGGERMAKILLVIETDWRDADDERLADIRCIEPPA